MKALVENKKFVVGKVYEVENKKGEKVGGKYKVLAINEKTSEVAIRFIDEDGIYLKPIVKYPIVRFGRESIKVHKAISEKYSDLYIMAED